MLKIKRKILGLFCLALISLASNWNAANAQILNLGDEPTIDTQSVRSGWSAGGNATYMTRLNPSNVPIINQGTAILFSANQLDFDFNLGYEAFVAKSFDGGGKLELKFSSLQDVTATASTTIPVAGSSFTTNPNTPISGPYVQTTTLDSGLLSGEVNLYIPIGPSSDWSLGFRWIEYDETMDSVVSAGNARFMTNVDNHLYGIQTGLDTLLTSNNLYELSIFGKGGVYGNNADQVTSFPDLPVTSQTFDTDVAAVVEAGFKGKLKITDNIAIDFGYTGLYLGGVAMAPDQLGTHSSVLGGFTSTRLDMSDTFYHGGFAGLSINR